MNKKIMLFLLILVLAAGAGWWLMKKNNFHLADITYDNSIDSIFFNLHFGMTRQAFYDSCWALNKTGHFMQGGNNLSVQHEITSEFGTPVNMNFFPNFSEDRLYQMPVMYNYQAWAPWNRELYSDTLIRKIITKYEREYEVKFTEDTTADGRPAFYNYTGPRKILLTIQDEQYVKVLMENEKYK